MFAFLLAAVLTQVDSAASSTQPQAQSTAPLREIVYKFSDNETVEYASDQSTSGYTVDQSHGGLAAPPESSRTTGGYWGTMTVDILQVDASDGYLKARLHEVTDAENGKLPFDAVFIVRPDGGLVIVSGSPDADMTSLMPYFATSYFGDNPLQQGSEWVSGSVVGKTRYETTTTVTGVSGNNVSIKAVTKAPNGTMHNDLTIDTTLEYNAPKLVPVTLDVLSTLRGAGDTSTAEQVSHYHFDRTSDTLDPNP
jgi:hypothetical protein